MPQIRRKFVEPPVTIQDKSSTDEKDSAIIFEQFQRASVTSLEDLLGSATEVRKISSNKRISDSDIAALNKVRIVLLSMFWIFVLSFFSIFKSWRCIPTYFFEQFFKYFVIPVSQNSC